MSLEPLRFSKPGRSHLPGRSSKSLSASSGFGSRPEKFDRACHSADIDVGLTLCRVAEDTEERPINHLRPMGQVTREGQEMCCEGPSRESPEDKGDCSDRSFVLSVLHKLSHWMYKS